MNTDELKDRWRGLARPRTTGAGQAPVADDPMIDKVTSGRAGTARERLMARYRMMFTVVAPVGVLCLAPVWRWLPWWGTLTVLLFFLVAALMDYHLYRGIRSIDLSADGVEEVAAKARHYRRRHHLFQLLLIPWAAVIVAIYLFSFGQEEGMMWGILGGGVIGLAIGLLMYFQMMRDYRSMQ